MCLVVDNAVQQVANEVLFRYIRMLGDIIGRRIGTERLHSVGYCLLLDITL